MLFFKRRQQNEPLQMAENSPIHHAEGYLTGQLLVSTPVLTDSVFAQSVIYLFAHNQEGAMGIVINQPMEMVSYDSLLDGEDDIAANAQQEIAMYYGGPVDRARGFVLHSADYNNAEIVHEGEALNVSANTTILRDMLHGNGPRHSLLAVGYAGWGAGQLEKEIEENSWITVPATPELVFHIDDDMKWAMASQSLGIDMNFYSHHVGHA